MIDRVNGLKHAGIRVRIREQGDLLSDVGNDISSAANAVGSAVSNVSNAVQQGIKNEMNQILTNPAQALANIAELKPVDDAFNAASQAIGVSIPNPYSVVAPFVTSIAKGDFTGALKAADGLVRMVADTLTMLPGIGTALGDALNVALTLMEGGSALDAAIDLLLGTPPLSELPQNLKDIVRRFADALVKLAGGSTIEDVALGSLRSAALDQVPAGAIRSTVGAALDALIGLVLHSKPMKGTASTALNKGAILALDKGDVASSVKMLTSAMAIAMNQANLHSRLAAAAVARKKKPVTAKPAAAVHLAAHTKIMGISAVPKSAAVHPALKAIMAVPAHVTPAGPPSTHQDAITSTMQAHGFPVPAVATHPAAHVAPAVHPSIRKIVAVKAK